MVVVVVVMVMMELSCGTDHEIIEPPSPDYTGAAAWTVFLTGHWLQTAGLVMLW